MKPRIRIHWFAAASAGLALWMMSAALAGEGHDHGDAPPAVSGNGPKRLPDGSVFLPKPAQRQMGVRTLPVVVGEHPRTVLLAGKVVMDPKAGGKVQALLAGRIEAGPQGLPSLGQAVRQGEVLAYVRPGTSAIERASQTAQLAELRAAQTLAAQRLSRLQALADSVPRKEIEAAASESASLAERVVALSAGLEQRDVLRAPVNGVIAASYAVAGQVVEARELLFEVIDPQRLQIEALTYDPPLARQIAGATLAVAGESVPLHFVGAAHSLREQALPLLFRAQGPALAGLALGQPVQLAVQTTGRVPGMALPAAALMKNPANQTIVWVKTAPERFVPRPVTAVPLDGVAVAVTAGLKPGERIATQAASLINQIR